MENISFVGIVQINPIAGNLKYNAEKIAYYIKKAQKSNLDLVVFPELSLMGYPIEDTIIRYPFLVEENLKWLKGLAKITDKTFKNLLIAVASLILSCFTITIIPADTYVCNINVFVAFRNNMCYNYMISL